MSDTAARDVPLTHGVDFERALQRLNADAGAAFRALMALRNDPSATPAQVADARAAAQAAQARAGELRPLQHDEIARILADEPPCG